MNVSFSFENSTPQCLRSPGSYESWYFDATDSSNSYTFVAIWYEGFPFSPYYLSRYDKWKKKFQKSKNIPYANEHTGFSFQLYEKDHNLLNYIKEKPSQIIVSKKPVSIAFEDCKFVYSQDKILLKIEFLMPYRNLKFKGNFAFSSAKSLSYPKKKFSYEYLHSWVVIAPSCKVKGTFQIISTVRYKEVFVYFSGQGYHDKNFGQQPLYEDIKNWSWTRASSPSGQLIFIFVKYKHTSPFKLILLIANGSVTEFDSDFEFNAKRFRFHLLSGFYPTSFTFSSKKQSSQIDYLDIPEKSPFYQRGHSKWTLDTGSETDHIFYGITEYLSPGFLKSLLIRQFIKTRIWRASQKSMMFFLYQKISSFFSFNKHFFSKHSALKQDSRRKPFSD